MLTTTLLLAVSIGQLVAIFALWVWTLRLGLCWGEVEGVTWKRLSVAVGGCFVIHVLVALLMRLDFPSDNMALAALLFGLFGVVIGDLVVIGLAFQLGVWRSLKAWLPTLVVPIFALLSSFFLIRPLLFEPFLIPTNSMAPTIAGTHAEGVCPECGATTYFTPVDERMRTVGPERQICDNFHVTEKTAADGEVSTGDRIAVAKFLTPRRWDLVVFRFPDYPSEFYVKRLVGLPGETIHIEEGCVFVNGKKLVPPTHLQGLEYMAQIPELSRQPSWGTPDQPAVLGEGEFFMLGDFSAAALDSRYWREGAPGHPPYAVPESYLRGVVTHTAWPPGRWRVHR